MAKLIYSALTSLDGYVAGEDGNFDWAEPSEEVHVLVNELERPVGTYLYGRRMYEVMAYWETADTVAEQPPFVRDYAKIWKAADKIVYSRTLAEVSSASAWSSNCSTSAALPTAWFTSITARGPGALIEDLYGVTVRELVRAPDLLTLEAR